MRFRQDGDRIGSTERIVRTGSDVSYELSRQVRRQYIGQRVLAARRNSHRARSSRLQHLPHRERLRRKQHSDCQRQRCDVIVPIGCRGNGNIHMCGMERIQFGRRVGVGRHRRGSPSITELHDFDHAVRDDLSNRRCVRYIAGVFWCRSFDNTTGININIVSECFDNTTILIVGYSGICNDNNPIICTC